MIFNNIDEITIKFPTANAPLVTVATVTVLVKEVIIENDAVPTKLLPRVTTYAVALLALSKNTLSTDVGTLAPLAPPEEALQCVVSLEFHVPAPPTQYLSAIMYIYSCIFDPFEITAVTYLDTVHLNNNMAKSAIDQLYEYLSEVKRPWLFLVSVFSVFLVAGAIVLSAVWFLTRR